MIVETMARHARSLPTAGWRPVTVPERPSSIATSAATRPGIVTQTATVQRGRSRQEHEAPAAATG